MYCAVAGGYFGSDKGVESRWDRFNVPPVLKKLDTCYVTRYTHVMIGSIKHKGLAALYWDDQSKGVMQSLVKRLKQILALLEAAETIDDMDAPRLRLHQLKGDLKGFYSVYVSGNWRVIFRFVDGDAEDVDLIDYH